MGDNAEILVAQMGKHIHKDGKREGHEGGEESNFLYQRFAGKQIPHPKGDEECEKHQRKPTPGIGITATH